MPSTHLADQGIDVISGHIDSPKAMIQTAEKRGMYSCGYHYNCSALAPKGYLTGAEWNWGPMYVKFVTDYQGRQASCLITTWAVLRTAP